MILRIYAVLNGDDGQELASLTYTKQSDNPSILRIKGDSALIMDRMNWFESDCHGEPLASKE